MQSKRKECKAGLICSDTSYAPGKVLVLDKPWDKSFIDIIKKNRLMF